MILKINNENYGFSTSTGTNLNTNQNYVLVGDPSSLKYSPVPASSSFLRTGSVDLYIYNKAIDKHVLIYTLHKIPPSEEIKYIVTENANIPPTGPTTNIHTEDTPPEVGDYFTFDKDLILDLGGRVTPLDDDYGHSVDIYNNFLAIGCRWYNRRLILPSAGFSLNYSSSCVDIYNTDYIYYNPFKEVTVYTGSKFAYTTIYSTQALCTPPESNTGSFGYNVSMNEEWLAISSPLYNDRGAVHMFQKTGTDANNDLVWNYHSTISGSDTTVNDQFGIGLRLNKSSGSNGWGSDYSGSVIIGSGRIGNSKVYYFEYSASQWMETHVFTPDRSVYDLAFIDYPPVIPCPGYDKDRYGYSVSLWENTVVIGAPNDRWIYEFVGSRPYRQGAFYIYDRCPPSSGINDWKLSLKSYGNDLTLKNNALGYSVDVWDEKVVATCPRHNINELTPCYIQGTLFQENACTTDLENTLQGQWILLEKIYTNSTSASWEWVILNVYQKKKEYLSPYRSFGYSTCIHDGFITVGAPIVFTGSISERTIDLDTSSYFSKAGDPTKTLANLLAHIDVSGKDYIYNLNNYRENFHIGNVFYRNGVLVQNVSGSVFEGLWFNELSPYLYEYEIDFQSKMTLYEKQIVCNVEPGEFNVSTNPTAIQLQHPRFDVNKNGKFDFQDLDILLRYMQWKYTSITQAEPTTNWSQSIVLSDDEQSFYRFYSKDIYDTNSVFSSSYSSIDTTEFYNELDLNQDSKVDLNDMNILWKYYTRRLTQTNYETWITPNSQRKFLSDIFDHLNTKTLRENAPQIETDFFDYSFDKFQMAGDKTGSYLAPYVTSIGLFNGLDLVAIAKLGSPIKITPDFPMNFVVKIDF